MTRLNDANDRNRKMPTAAETKADQLFQRHHVSELRQTEHRIRQEAESKRTELSQLVGERYRDLMEAADKIIGMRTKGVQLRDGLNRLDLLVDSKRIVGEIMRSMEERKQSETKILDGSKMDKKLIYPLASQLKILVDTTEQIWHSMEGNRYLAASQLFLLAKEIYLSLGKSPESLVKRFPVIEHQWAAIERLKSQILQKTRQHLRNIDQSDTGLAETTCALMLLAKKALSEALNETLEARFSAVKSLLESQSASAVERMTSVHSIIKATLYHIHNIYRSGSNGEPSLADKLINSIEGVDLLTVAHDSGHGIVRLFTSAATHSNLTAIVRHLPAEIRQFAPRVNIGSHDPQLRLTNAKVDAQLSAWFKSVQQLVVVNGGGGSKSILNNVCDLDQLMECRRALWKLLESDERQLCNGNVPTGGEETGRQHSANHNSSWLHLMQSISSQSPASGPISLWSDLWRPVIVSHACQLIQSQLTGAIKTTIHLADQYAVDDLPQDTPEQNIGQYLWLLRTGGATTHGATRRLSNKQPSAIDASQPLSPIAQSPLKHVSDELDISLPWGDSSIKSWSLTPLVRKLVQRLNDELSEIHRKVWSWRSTVAAGTQEDLFHENADWLHLCSFYRQTLIESFNQLCDYFSGKIPPPTTVSGPSQRDADIELDLFYGRLARAIVDHCHQLGGAMRALASAQVSKQLPPDRNYNNTRNMIDEQSMDLPSLNERLMALYVRAYRDWIDRVVIAGFCSRLKKSYFDANNDNWSTMLSTLHTITALNTEKHRTLSATSKNGGIISCGTWEPLAVQLASTGGEEEQSKDDLLVPAHPSEQFISICRQIINHIQRQGAHTVDRDRVIHPLSFQLLSALLEEFNHFIGDESRLESFAEKQRIQLYFDFLFGWRLVEGSRFGSAAFAISEHQSDDCYRRFTRVRDQLKRLIDPIEFTLIAGRLEQNVQICYGRYQTLFGYLTQFNLAKSTALAGGSLLSSPSPAPYDASTTIQSSILHEQHSLLAMMPPPPRLQMLPTTYAPPAPPRPSLSAGGVGQAPSGAELVENLLRSTSSAAVTTSSPGDKSLGTTMAAKNSAAILSSGINTLTNISSSLQSQITQFF